MRSPFRCLVACVLPAGLWLAGCGGSRHSPAEKYILVAANVQISYWSTAGAGFMKAARELGVQGEILGPKAYDVQGEKDAFQAAIGKKPAGILVSASDAKALESDINSAIAQGIPVLTMDADSPGSKRLFFVGTNNHDAAKLGGQLLVKALNGKGNVAVFTMPSQENLEQRLAGYREAIADTGIKITDVIDIKGDPRVAFDSASDIIAKRKDKIDAFVCLEALAGKEVADVLTRNNVTNKLLIAFDTDKDTLDWIQKGVIRATIAQKPYTMGYFGVHLLDNMFHNKPGTLDKNWQQDPFSVLPRFVDTGSTLVDKSNVGAFLSAQESASK